MHALWGVGECSYSLFLPFLPLLDIKTKTETEGGRGPPLQHTGGNNTTCFIFSSLSPYWDLGIS
jgi:hypothetical protein